MWSLRTSQIVIIVAGCLGMAYTQLTACAAAIKYIQAMGGNSFHVGVFNALPTGMLFMQFVAAQLANRLKYRRQWWFWVTILQRLMLLPFVLGPWLFPELGDAFWLWAFLVAWAINNGMTHFSTPLWLSWMGDYLPKEGLNTYWGVRHLWMQFTAALMLLGSGLYLLDPASDFRWGYAMIVLVATVLGVIDILMFYKVDEPPVTQLPQASVWQVLKEPFQHTGFRRFIGFTCFWHVAAMVGAPFISLYLLEWVGLSLFQVLLLWTCSWIGGALSSRWLGRLAEAYGNRPVLIMCTTLKSVNMFALLMAGPGNTWVTFSWMAPLFMIDMALNTGIAIANNGFMLKQSPAANRTMFIAAGTAVAGLAGGVTSVVCGLILVWLANWSVDLPGYTINGYKVLFCVSILLRFIAVGLVRHVQEPKSRSVSHVVTMLVGVNVTQVLRFPVGLYRRRRLQEGLSEDGSPDDENVPVATPSASTK
ncbi:MAG: MFS transporter [Planctomycetaceae bacterium]